MISGKSKWEVKQVNTLDNFYHITVTVDYWLAHNAKRSLESWEILLAAIHAVTSHEYWEYPLRETPRVLYDYANDDVLFLFKIDNNGTTFIVGRI